MSLPKKEELKDMSDDLLKYMAPMMDLGKPYREELIRRKVLKQIKKKQ